MTFVPYLFDAAAVLGNDAVGGMVRRKGELTASQVDRDWPHQVALPASAVIGPNFPIIEAFCAEERLSVCLRRHSLRRGDAEFIIYCFRHAEEAVRFQERFGGEAGDPNNPRAWRRQQQQRS